MKHRLVLAVTIAAALTIAACGDDDDAATSSTAATTGSAATRASAAPAGSITLVTYDSWSDALDDPNSGQKQTHTGLRFKPMSLAKQTVINQFIQQRRDEVIMAKIGLDKFTDSVPVAGLD